MAENPLLPNKRLRELYALMQRCRDLDAKQARKSSSAGSARPAREAMLAAAAIHLQPGDILCSTPSDTTAATLAPAPRPNELAEGKSVRAPEAPAPLPIEARLALYAAMAVGLKASGSGGMVVALASTSAPEPGWSEALTYAQLSQAPLLLLCADTTDRAGSRNASTLSWPAVTKAAARLKLPVLPVDGEDAVAVYRVVQECASRARMGEGPAVLWCLMGANGAALSRSAQPLARMQQYLAVRGLLPSRSPKKRS